LVSKSSAAFITFANRSDAEKAVEKLGFNVVVKGQTLRLAWSKPHIYDPTAPPPATTTTAGFFSLPTATPASSSYYAAPLTPNVKPVYPSMNPTRIGAKTDR
jgi:hypothetical protein